MSSRGRSNDEFPTLGCGIAVAIGVVALVVGLFFVTQVMHRVDPGYVGVIVDYRSDAAANGKASIKQAPTGSYIFLNPNSQRLAQYPISQQTLSMLRSTNEGKVQGDDSVQCQDQNGIQINQDVSILWRVNPDEAGQLYQLRPNIPLVGNGGSDIEDLIVRRESRNAVNFACGSFTYDQVYGGKKAEFSDRAEKILRDNLAASHIIVDKVSLGETFLGEAQQQSLAAKAAAQQKAETAAFQKQEQQNIADGEIAKANGASTVTDIQAKAAANKTLQEAEANKQAAKLLIDQFGGIDKYLQWLEANKWNGQMPQVVGGNTPAITYPVPAPSATPTTKP